MSMKYIVMVGPSELRSALERRCEHDTGLRLITTTPRFSVFGGHGTDVMVDSMNTTTILGYLFSTALLRN